MDRYACIDVPALALQLLLADHPDWKTFPAAVVDADEPGGVLLEVSERAWRSRLRPGMRYGAALALDGRLRAGVVAAAQIEEARTRIADALRRHTPHVEPSREEPGVFWLDASGLVRLYVSAQAWANAVARAVNGCGFEAGLACGFTRFGSYAFARALCGASHQGRAGPKARSSRRLLVCESHEEEKRLVAEVALERLGIDPKLRDAMARLGIATVGDFLRLPAGSIARRFGEEAERLHRRARGQQWDPLVPEPAKEPLLRSVILEDPVSDQAIVLLLVRRLLATLLAMLASRGQAAAAVTARLRASLKHEAAALEIAVRPAEATLEEDVLLDLLRLRLGACVAGGPETEKRRRGASSSFIEIEVEAEAAAAGHEQLRLFHDRMDRTQRDLAAGSRALARLRAELGEHAVVRAVLREGHLPEAGFTWEPAATLVAPSARVVRTRPLVRRIYEKPIALAPKPFRERDDCWIPSLLYEAPHDATVRDAPAGSASRTVPREPAGTARTASREQSSAAARTPIIRSAAHGRVDNMDGPYIVSGGWWNREVHREYHFARTEDGEILWVFYDRHRRRWFLAGKVE
jgi:protein ImuB